MALDVRQCVACDKTIGIPPNALGRTVRCPHCHAQMIFPDPAFVKPSRIEIVLCKGCVSQRIYYPNSPYHHYSYPDMRYLSHMPSCPACKGRSKQSPVIEKWTGERKIGDRRGYRAVLPRILDLLRQKPLPNLFIEEAADAMLEILMRPHQEHQPDAEAILLESSIDKIIARGEPYSSPVTRVFRSEYLGFDDRGDWFKDRFFQLLILTFALGVGIKLKHLPPPHNHLCEFYHAMAEQQRLCIRNLWAHQRLMREIREGEIREGEEGDGE